MQSRDVILDTNFVLLPGQIGVDVFDTIEDALNTPYRLCVLTGTIDELKGLKKDNTKDAKAAKIGLELLQAKDVTLLPGKDVDDALVNRAEGGAVIATQDKPLQERIKAVNGTVLRLRQQQYAVLEE